MSRTIIYVYDDILLNLPITYTNDSVL